MIYGQEARARLLDGVSELERAVGSTMGAKGSNVLIDRGEDMPHVTKDGVTVAQSIRLDDKVQDMAAKVVIGAASRTCKDVGDGTTACVVLAKSILENGIRRIKDGADPILLSERIKELSEVAIEKLYNYSRRINCDNDLKNIATISANNNPEIGSFVAGIFDKVNVDSIIKVESSTEIGMSAEITDGFKVENSGYMNYKFANNPNTMEWEANNVRVLVCDLRISDIANLVPAIEECAKTNTPILLYVNSMDANVLELLLMNKVNARLNICVAKIPYGSKIHGCAEDMNVVVGGSLFDETHKLTNAIDIDCFGNAEKVIVTKDSVSIIGRNTGIRLKSKITELKSLEDKEDDLPSREIYAKRISALSGGVARIKVGAASEVELKEKMDILDDVVSSCRAALRSGVTTGGGTALMRVMNEFINSEVTHTAACDVLISSMSAPFARIATNAGSDHLELIKELNKMEDYPSCGYDAKNRCIVKNMYSVGIIDPIDVVVTSFRNAVSAACTLMSTNCIIS